MPQTRERLYGGTRGPGLTRPPFRYYFDPELKIVHLYRDCSGLKMARKYDTFEEIMVRDLLDAKRLDEKGRACHTCWKREGHWARKDGRNPRPGFNAEPRE